MFNTRKLTLLGSAMAVSMLALSACSTYTKAGTPQMKADDVHFPVRSISDVDQTKITTFRADTVLENNCVYAVNVRGKAPSKRYVLTWPKGSTMEYLGKTLQVVSAGADKGDRTRSVADIGTRAEFIGVLKEEPYKYRKGYHLGTAERECGNAYIARVVSWKNVK